MGTIVKQRGCGSCDRTVMLRKLYRAIGRDISSRITLTDEQFDSVIAAIETRLSEKECNLIKLRFGLLDGYEHDLPGIEARLKIRLVDIKRLQDKALDKLRRYTEMPELN